MGGGAREGEALTPCPRRTAATRGALAALPAMLAAPLGAALRVLEEGEGKATLKAGTRLRPLSAPPAAPNLFTGVEVAPAPAAPPLVPSKVSRVARTLSMGMGRVGGLLPSLLCSVETPPLLREAASLYTAESREGEAARVWRGEERCAATSSAASLGMELELVTMLAVSLACGAGAMLRPRLRGGGGGAAAAAAARTPALARAVPLPAASGRVGVDRGVARALPLALAAAALEVCWGGGRRAAAATVRRAPSTRVTLTCSSPTPPLSCSTCTACEPCSTSTSLPSSSAASSSSQRK